MLLNNDGQRVNLSPKLKGKALIAALIPLREVLVPSTGHCNEVFKLESRARIIDKRRYA